MCKCCCALMENLNKQMRVICKKIKEFQRFYDI